MNGIQEAVRIIRERLSNRCDHGSVFETLQDQLTWVYGADGDGLLVNPAAALDQSARNHAGVIHPGIQVSSEQASSLRELIGSLLISRFGPRVHVAEESLVLGPVAILSPDEPSCWY